MKQKMNEIPAHTAKKWLNCIYYQTTWVIEEMDGLQIAKDIPRDTQTKLNAKLLLYEQFI